MSTFLRHIVYIVYICLTIFKYMINIFSYIPNKKTSFHTYVLMSIFVFTHCTFLYIYNTLLIFLHTHETFLCISNIIYDYHFYMQETFQIHTFSFLNTWLHFLKYILTLTFFWITHLVFQLLIHIARFTKEFIIFLF